MICKQTKLGEQIKKRANPAARESRLKLTDEDVVEELKDSPPDANVDDQHLQQLVAGHAPQGLQAGIHVPGPAHRRATTDDVTPSR